MYVSRTLGPDGRLSLETHRDYIRQSIRDALTTPRGSRLMRPEYGFPFDLIDRAMNSGWVMDVYMAATETAMNAVSEVTFDQVRVLDSGPGYIELMMYFYYEGNQETVDVRIGK